MKKSFLFYVTAFLLIFSLSVTVFAHSGRTDSSGGHNKTSDGTYHYHSGNDRTTEYSAPPNSSNQVTTPTPIPTSDPKLESAKDEISYYPENKEVPDFGKIFNISVIEKDDDGDDVAYFYDGINEGYREVLNAEGFSYVGSTKSFMIYAKGDLKITVGVVDGYFIVLFPIEEQHNLEDVKTKEANIVQETNKNIAVVLDDENIQFDQPPENINGRVMVPIRYVVEKMGCSVEWDDETQTVYINESDTPIEKTAVKTNDINIYVNNEEIVFADQQPVNKNGRILIPVRFVTEKLGYGVKWDSVLKTVNIVKE